MNTTTAVKPVWAEDAFLRGFWVATEETPEWTANSTARRGNWKIGIGYRAWINSEVGSIDRVAEGLSAAEIAGGKLISAPDDWPAERVVSAMVETLAANGLDEVPY